MSRENDCQHCYALFFDMPYDDFLHFVINNGTRLQDILSNYNVVAKDIILDAKIKKIELYYQILLIFLKKSIRELS